MKSSSVNYNWLFIMFNFTFRGKHLEFSRTLKAYWSDIYRTFINVINCPYIFKIGEISPVTHPCQLSGFWWLHALAEVDFWYKSCLSYSDPIKPRKKPLSYSWIHVLLIYVLSIQSMFYQSSQVHILSYAIYNAFQYGASEDLDRVETLVSQFEEEP